MWRRLVNHLICRGFILLKVIGAYKKVSKRNDKQNLLKEYLNYGQAKIVVKAKTQKEVLDCVK